MDNDICNLLYPSRIYCLSKRQLYTQEKVYLVIRWPSMSTLFWSQKRKLDTKYSTKVVQIIKCT